MAHPTDAPINTDPTEGTAPDAAVAAELLATPVPDLADLSAETVLGESPREALKQFEAKVAGQVPVDRGRDEKGRFAPVEDGEKKPAETKPPAVTKPAEPKKAAKATPAKAPETPPAPAKIKIAGKEYTPEELEKALAEKPKAAPEPAKAPEPPAAPETPPTPEELAKHEDGLVKELMGQIRVPEIAEDALEKILVGGKDGAAVLRETLKDAVARAVVHAQKAVFSQVNPAFATLVDKLGPVLDQHTQLERVAIESQFVSQFPEYSGEHLQRAREVAQALYQQYPEQVAKMDRASFLNEVDRQTSRLIQEEYARWSGDKTGSWKDFVKSRTTAAAPAAPAEAPAAPPATPPKPAVKPPPPNANSPGRGSSPPADWGRSVAATLLT